jgi:phage head maturation protease
MDKYIYGCAKCFHFLEEENGEFVALDRDSLKISSEVGLTLGHNMDQVLTTTAQNNLDLVIAKKGIYFRYHVTGEEGERAYWKVKNQALRHCSSIRYTGHLEKWRGSNLFYIEVDSVMYELCLTNSPADCETFCTTQADDIRLAPIDWSVKPIMDSVNIWEVEVGIHKLKVMRAAIG